MAFLKKRQTSSFKQRLFKLNESTNGTAPKSKRDRASELGSIVTSEAFLEDTNKRKQLALTRLNSANESLKCRSYRN